MEESLIKSGRSLLTTAVLLCCVLVSSTCQDLIIPAGLTVTCSGGNIVLNGNLINDGSLVNRNNTVIFEGINQTLAGSTPVTFENLRIGTTSSTLIISPGHAVHGILLCDGTLNASGNLTFLSTETNTALIDGSGAGQVTGNVVIQRYLPEAFGYKYLSSPFRDATVSELGDDMDLLASFPTFYRYDENRTTAGWVNYTSPANTLNPCEGYAVNFGPVLQPRTIEMNGVVNNGPLSVTLYNHDNQFTTGFNLVGNPYPSPIDWNATSGWTRNNIDNALYFYRSGTTDQYGGTYSTYMNGVSSDDVVNNIIPSMQAFFVHVSDGIPPVTATYGMDNRVRITDGTHPFSKSDNGSEIPLLRLTAGYSDDSASFDPLVIYFDEKATSNFDGQYDALKLFNTDPGKTNFYTFSKDGTRLSINALPQNPDSLGKIRLGISTGRDADVIFKIKTIRGDFLGTSILFIDSAGRARTNLFPDKEYKVSLLTGDYTDRFYIEFQDLETGINSSPEIADPFNVYSSYGTIKVDIDMPGQDRGILQIYNLMGQLLYIRKIYESGCQEFSPGIKEGIYLISYLTGNRKFSKRIYFRKGN
jgi:hypothetical protein